MDVSEREIESRLYCDNAAAIQLCVLESGSWRTRHLRLRGAVVRQDLEEGLWSLTHVDGVFMPADLGTKAVGPARLEDLSECAICLLLILPCLVSLHVLK